VGRSQRDTDSSKISDFILNRKSITGGLAHYLHGGKTELESRQQMGDDMATKSVTVRLPAELVAKCDNAAARRKQTRTWVIARAIAYAFKPKSEKSANVD